MRRTVLSGIFLSFWMTGALLANTPVSKVTIEVQDPGPMPADAIVATAVVTNEYEESVVVTFEPYSVKNLALEVKPSVLALDAGESADVEISGEATADRKFAVFFSVAVQDGEGADLPPAVLPFHMTVGPGERGSSVATLGDYEALFVDVPRLRLSGVGLASIASRGVPAGRVVPDPVEPEPEPEDDDSTELRRDTAPVPFDAFLPEMGFDEIDLREGDLEEELDGLAEGPLDDATTGRASSGVGTNVVRATTIKGVFRWIDTKGGVRKAWGWRVALFVRPLLSPFWFDTGSRATVKADGTWAIQTDTNSLHHYRAIIFPSNAYFNLVNRFGTQYKVTLPAFSPKSSVIDYHSYYVDIQKDMAPGLGELHLNAYDLWVKLANGGYSPVRSKPIKLEFPSKDKCGACSMNYKITIPAADATSSHTIRHELGHELMLEKWGKMPAGSGGYHEWPKCATAGLALSEGFAHFVSWWSTVNRTTATGSWGGGWNGEALPGSVCKGIGTNELRVAATFWDLHDKKVDGVDTYSYGNSVRIFKMILNGGVKNTMTQLLPQLENGGGFEWWKIEPVLEMNFTD